MGFLHVGKADFELLVSGDLPTVAFLSAGITDMSHCAWSVVSCYLPHYLTCFTGLTAFDILDYSLLVETFSLFDFQDTTLLFFFLPHWHVFLILLSSVFSFHYI